MSHDVVLCALCRAARWRQALRLGRSVDGSAELLASCAPEAAPRLLAEVVSQVPSAWSQRLRQTLREENQWVKMGAHHTLEIELNNKLTLGKAGRERRM